MKYALVAASREVVAVLDDGRLLRLARVFPGGPSTVLDALLDPDLPLRIALLPVRDDMTLPAETALDAPIPRPNRILAIGRNYAEHARELGNAVPEEPVVFLKASSTVVGPGAPVRIPDWVGRVDFEAELMVVIGKGGRAIPVASAMEHVAGYTCFNDVTARERAKANQAKGHPWFLPKSLDTFGPMGPVVATPDEIPDPSALNVRLEIDGVVRQDGSTADMIHTVPELISHLSRWIALEPGDVVATGTPAGVGPVVPGETMTVEIAPIGRLTNPVIAESN
ncbi:MAG: fumarylacetoacetate hydrolase family protein [Armatimonadota bacterium]